MRVLFLQNNGINESLALCEASALLRRAGHDTLLLLEREERWPEREIRRYDPGLVVISAGLGLHDWPFAVARRVRAWVRAPIFCGGTAPTVLAESFVQPPMDGVLIGEADETLVELADGLEAGRDPAGIAGLALLREGRVLRTPIRPPPEDLDAFPLPDRQLYYRYPFIRRLSVKRFITGRGCAHRCTYCTTDALRRLYHGHGRLLRRKSPARVVEEILAVRAIAPIRLVHFSDDLFVTRGDWLEEFCALYPRRVGLPFTCNSSVKLLPVRQVPALAAAGCVGVALGVETGNEDLRQTLLRKRTTNEQIERLGRAIRASGMRLATFNMLAIPGSSLEDDLSTLSFNLRLQADLVRVNRAMPTPGTAFSELEGWPPGGPRQPPLDPPRARLLALFRVALRLGIPVPVVRELIRVPQGPLAPLLMLASPLAERRFYGLGLAEGLRYWLHTGDPAARTTNSHQII
jgi:anaerobic magnesium-protoporphyrin IX monomethyl ester cyclase